jgi:undecaprenyl-diphosphatase
MMPRWLGLRPRLFWPAIEVGTLISVLIVAGGVLVFAELMEVVEQQPGAFDRAVLHVFRDRVNRADAIGPRWVELAIRDVTALGGATVLTLMTAAVVGFLFVDGKRAAAVLVLLSVSSGALLSTGLKYIFARPRPDLVPHLVEVSSASFPSGHAMLSAVVYLTLGALLSRVEGPPRVKVYVLSVAVALTLTIGVSRVYLGVHWPTDVLAGWCAGAAWAVVCWRVALFLQRRGDVEVGAEGRARDP